MQEIGADENVTAPVQSSVHLEALHVRGAAPDLARLPIVFDPRALGLAEGVRAGLSIAAIIALSAWLHRPELIEAALAALFTCLCDAGGPIRRRVPALLAFCTLGGLVVGIGGLMRGIGWGAALPFAALVIFLGTYARVYGQSALQVGTLLCVVTALSMDRVLDGPGALELGGLFFAGGAWAAVLTLVIWRIRPYRPARRAMAQVFLSMAALVRDLQGLVHEATGPADWERHARAHRRRVREAIEAARGVVLDTVRGRGPASERAAQAVMRVEAADQLFGVLIALSTLLEEATPAPGGVERMLRRLGPLLVVSARAIEADWAAHARTRRAVDAIAAEVAGFPPGALHRLAEALVERLAVVDLLAQPSVAGDGSARAAGAPLWTRVRVPLLANLNWRSTVLRHSLRAVVTAVPAVAFTLFWFTPYDHWLTITIVSTMQPYFGNTFARAVERVGGTMLGGLIAVGLGLVLTGPLALALAMFPLAMLALALRPVSLSLFMAVITPMIVLLIELDVPGSSSWQIAGIRALLTLAGGLVAVAGCALLWPSWEPDRLAGEIRAAIAAHGRYAAAEFSWLLREVDDAAVEQARRAAGLASNNVEASISRVLIEPLPGVRARLEAAMTIDAALRRFAGRMSAMQLDFSAVAGCAPDVLRAWRGWIAGSMAALAAGDAALAARPGLPEGDAAEALARVARQIELVAGVVQRA